MNKIILIALLAQFCGVLKAEMTSTEFHNHVLKVRQRIDSLVQEVLSIDLKEKGPKLDRSTKLLTAYGEDKRLLEMAALLLERKGVAAAVVSEPTFIALVISTDDPLATYSVSLMWSYQNGIFDRFGISRSVGDSKKPNQAVEPTPPGRGGSP